MTCCFSTRASVAIVLRTHPCVYSGLWVNTGKTVVVFLPQFFASIDFYIYTVENTYSYNLFMKINSSLKPGWLKKVNTKIDHRVCMSQCHNQIITITTHESMLYVQRCSNIPHKYKLRWTSWVTWLGPAWWMACLRIDDNQWWLINN